MKMLVLDVNPPITSNQLNILLFQIKDLIMTNSKLLNPIYQVVRKWNKSSSVGHVFIARSSDLTMYTDYVNNYEHALKTYHICMRSAEFRDVIARIQQAQERRSLELTDLLITPIQRIPRYPLLLRELLKYTDSDHDDYPNIQKAIESMDKIAQIINQRKKESEHLYEFEVLKQKLLNVPFVC